MGLNELLQILQAFLDFRCSVERRAKFKLSQAEERYHIVEDVRVKMRVQVVGFTVSLATCLSISFQDTFFPYCPVSADYARVIQFQQTTLWVLWLSVSFSFGLSIGNQRFELKCRNRFI